MRIEAEDILKSRSDTEAEGAAEGGQREQPDEPDEPDEREPQQASA